MRQVCWAVLLVGIFAAAARGAEPYLPPYEIGKLLKVERQGDFVVFHAQRASLRVNFVSDSIVRVFVEV
ncbi:MAG: hypothetical protein ABSA70_09160 [Terriglobia bacterium]